MNGLDVESLLAEWDSTRDRSVPEGLQAVETAMFLEDTFGVVVLDEEIDPRRLADVVAMRDVLAGIGTR